MGLFTNRKRNEEDVDGLSEAADMLAQLNSSPEEALDDVEPIEVAPIDLASVTTEIPDAEPIADTITDELTDELTEAPAEVAAPPQRRLEDRPRAQAGNVEIDAEGLLSMLGVDDSATLIDISEAQQRFLADHQPVDSDDADAAAIKEAIRREINSAYASFRLTYNA